MIERNDGKHIECRVVDTDMLTYGCSVFKRERTCHMDRFPATTEGSIGYLLCSYCECGFDYTEEPFHCMNCGAKVVEE